MGEDGVAIEFKLGAEDAHKMGELGVAQIRAWLDATYCFRIDSFVDDVDRDGKPSRRCEFRS
jgi:hypothetical protein